MSVGDFDCRRRRANAICYRPRRSQFHEHYRYLNRRRLVVFHYLFSGRRRRTPCRRSFLAQVYDAVAMISVIIAFYYHRLGCLIIYDTPAGQLDAASGRLDARFAADYAPP